MLQGGRALLFSLQISTFGQGTVPPGWALAKSTEMQRLYYIKSGVGSYLRADGQRIGFRHGCFYLFPYNYHACFQSGTSDPIDHVYFDFVSMPPILVAEPLCIPADTETLIHLAQLLLDTTIGHDRPDHETGRALLTLALRLLNEKSTIPFYTDEIVSAALRRIWEDYAAPLRISELAAEVHLEENYFIRRFRRVMGQTPYAYLRTYRLALARQALASGDTLAQAAEKVGYQDAASLSRALRAMGRF